jgi:hypothetical protein
VSAGRKEDPLRTLLFRIGCVLGVTGFLALAPSLQAQPACTITCPANVTVSNDPNQCGAVINYPAPTTGGTCGTVTCTPPSGSFYPSGTTTITCTTTAGPTCSFTATVNDTQPPQITCPPNQTGPAAGASTPVTFNPPVASDNCPGVTVVCNPPSGSSFPVGTTTDTRTATDASSNTATCSFTVGLEAPVVPTVSWRGLVALGLILASVGFYFVRRI